MKLPIILDKTIFEKMQTQCLPKILKNMPEMIALRMKGNV